MGTDSDKRVAVTDGGGQYAFVGMGPGTYRTRTRQVGIGEPVAAGQRPAPPIGAELTMLLHRLQLDRGTAWSPGKTFPVRNGRVETNGFNGIPREMELEAFKGELVRLLP